MTRSLLMYVRLPRRIRFFDGCFIVVLAFACMGLYSVRVVAVLATRNFERVPPADHRLTTYDEDTREPGGARRPNTERAAVP